jgi:PAS domain S-box-containing protein
VSAGAGAGARAVCERVSERDEWAGLFAAAFRQSRNAMALADTARNLVDVNGAYLKLLGYSRKELIGSPVSRFVIDGPLLSPAEWRQRLASGQFAGEANMRAADGRTVAIQWAATVEVVTGRQLVLVVALSVSTWGGRFRRASTPTAASGTLSQREREIVQLVALGNTGPEIADELQISHDTVRTHARNAMLKVGARSRAHLVAKALGDGLVLGPRR